MTQIISVIQLKGGAGKSTNRKTAGIIIEELITKYGDKVKAYKHPIEDAK